MQITYLTAKAPGILREGWYILRRGGRIGPFRSDTEARNWLSVLDEEEAVSEPEECSRPGLGGP